MGLMIATVWWAINFYFNNNFLAVLILGKSWELFWALRLVYCCFLCNKTWWILMYLWIRRCKFNKLISLNLFWFQNLFNSAKFTFGLKSWIIRSKWCQLFNFIKKLLTHAEFKKLKYVILSFRHQSIYNLNFEITSKFHQLLFPTKSLPIPANIN